MYLLNYFNEVILFDQLHSDLAKRFICNFMSTAQITTTNLKIKCLNFSAVLSLFFVDDGKYDVLCGNSVVGQAFVVLDQPYENVRKSILGVLADNAQPQQHARRQLQLVANVRFVDRRFQSSRHLSNLILEQRRATLKVNVVPKVCQTQITGNYLKSIKPNNY